MVKGTIITDESELKQGMKVEVVKRNNRGERDVVEIGPDKKINFGGASMNLSGVDKIGCHCVVA